MFRFHRDSITKTVNQAVTNRTAIRSEDLIRLRKQGEMLSLGKGKITSQQSGQYVSRFKGRGMEFDEARLYQPGDDVRTLDWRVTARTGKPHTKLYREERERAVFTCVDLRSSMFFATRGMFKSVMAAQAAAVIGWAANKQGDRLGGLVFDDNDHHELRPVAGKRGVLQLIRQITIMGTASASTQNNEGINQAITRLRRVVRPGSLVFLFSDFRGLDEQGHLHLRELSKHNDVMLLHVFDSLEETLPDSGNYAVSNGDRRIVFSSNSTTRQQHHSRFKNHQQALEQLCRYPGMNYLPCRTHDDLTILLRQRLSLRMQ